MPPIDPKITEAVRQAFLLGTKQGFYSAKMMMTLEEALTAAEEKFNTNWTEFKNETNPQPAA